jgi:ferredoxin
MTLRWKACTQAAIEDRPDTNNFPGACEGSCSCSTCHVIVEDEEMFDKIPEATDDENDMLDLAFGLTETSRLGCQIEMTKELDGLRVRLPSMTRNLQASDFSKKS